MDTSEVAPLLGTTPRVFRQFLRSGYSTFASVGSGSRYDFTEKDIPTLQRRFSEWKGDGKPRPANERKPRVPQAKTAKDAQRTLDMKVWAEEGNVVIEDIRDPRVRARVIADAQAAEDRLMQRLIAAGVHVYQLGDRKLA